VLAAKLGVSIGTLKNWERGWTQPNRRFWAGIRTVLIHDTAPDSTPCRMADLP
jgi:DNA-binding transcriptional regulator YiaG